VAKSPVAAECVGLAAPKRAGDCVSRTIWSPAEVEAGPIHTDLDTPDLGELRLTSRGVGLRSSSLLRLDGFPELLSSSFPLDKVTEDEAISYKPLARYVSAELELGAFDPPSPLRISRPLTRKLAGDLTVIAA